jgi:hypothetical protein
MKFLFLLASLSIIASVGAQANEVVERAIGYRHCHNDGPAEGELLERAKVMAEAKCLSINGYSNAKQIGEPVYNFSRAVAWDSSCATIDVTGVKAKYECLNHNK